MSAMVEMQTGGSVYKMKQKGKCILLELIIVLLYKLSCFYYRKKSDENGKYCDFILKAHGESSIPFKPNRKVEFVCIYRRCSYLKFILFSSE